MKTKKLVLLLFTLLFASMFLVGCEEIQRRNAENNKGTFSSGDFVCYAMNEQEVAVVALTDSGKNKEVILLPEKIAGMTVVRIGAPDCSKVFESEKLKKLYLPFDLSDQGGAGKIIINAPNAYISGNPSAVCSLLSEDVVCKKVVLDEVNYNAQVSGEKYKDKVVKYNVLAYDADEYSNKDNYLWGDYVADDAPVCIPDCPKKDNKKVVGWVDWYNNRVWDGTVEGTVELTAQYGYEDGTFWVSLNYGEGALGGYVSGAEHMKKVVITDKIGGVAVQNIMFGAFCGDTAIEEVVFPDSVTCVSSGAFKDCTSLFKLTFGENSGLKTVFNDAFAGCTALKTFVAPASLVNIYGGFADCTGLETVALNNVETLYPSTFSGCVNIKSFSVSENNDKVVFDGAGVYNSIGGTMLVAYFGGADKKSYTLLEECNSIGQSVFKDNKTLEELNGGAAFVTVNYGAFENCTALKKVSLIAMGVSERAFAGCDKLESVTIRGNGNVSVSDNAFAGTPSTCVFRVHADKVDYYRSNAERIGIAGTIEAIE